MHSKHKFWKTQQMKLRLIASFFIKMFRFIVQLHLKWHFSFRAKWSIKSWIFFHPREVETKKVKSWVQNSTTAPATANYQLRNCHESIVSLEGDNNDLKCSIATKQDLHQQESFKSNIKRNSWCTSTNISNLRYLNLCQFSRDHWNLLEGNKLLQRNK